MYSISPAQIKAARTLLDWTRDDLALASCVSPKTVARFEKGEKISLARLIEIRRSLEKEGVEFLSNKGVVLNNNDAQKYSGPDGMDQFYDDMLTEAKEHGGDILALYNTSEEFAASLGIIHNTHLNRLTNLSRHAKIKCLLTNPCGSSFSLPSVHVKALASPPTGIWSTLLCGNKIVFVFMTNKNEFWYYVITSFDIALKERMHLLELWGNALPFTIEAKQKA
jgi:transcriptional regulator with XRE-family HTH domain